MPRGKGKAKAHKNDKKKIDQTRITAYYGRVSTSSKSAGNPGDCSTNALRGVRAEIVDLAADDDNDIADGRPHRDMNWQRDPREKHVRD